LEAVVTRALFATASGLALAAAVALASVSTGLHADAAEQPPAATAASAATSVTLLTGERVLLDRAPDGHVTAGLAGSSAYTAMGTDTAQYVVPTSARPYLGHPLDLSLFDVTSPPTAVRVTWTAGASPHAIPGLDLSSGKITDRGAFAAAVKAGLAGVAGIRAAGPVSPAPHFPLATLIVKGLDRAGAVVGGGTVSVVNVDDAQRFVSLAAFYEGSVAFSVPVGRYTLSASISTPGDARAESLVVLPEVTVDGSQTVVSVDARTATVEIPVPSTPDPTTRAEQFSLTMGRVSAGGEQVTTTDGYLGSLPTVYITPVSGVSTGSLHWYSYFRLKGATDLYDVEFPYDDQIPATQPSRVDPVTLARLGAAYHYDGAGTPVGSYRPAFLPWERFALRPISQVTAPLQRAEYVTARPDLAWVNAVVWRADEFNGIDQSARTVYHPGERAADVYLTAPLVPGVSPDPDRCTACRDGDTLALAVPPWSDATHAISDLVPGSTLTVKSATQLYSGPNLLWEGTTPTGRTAMPAGDSDLRLVVTTDKSAPWTTTATHATTQWTWHSTATGPQPLLFLAYDLGADLTNAVPAGKPVPVRIRSYRQAPDSAAPAASLTLDASADDGTTWTPVPTTPAAGGTFTATLPAAPAGFLSLRAHAAGPHGDAIDQTVIRAVRVTQ
jgi:hypothetical protein